MIEKEVLVADRLFRLLKVRDTNALVDSINPETFAVDERLPYWADLWTSSVELARACMVDLHVESKRLLDLGCGLGLAGIAAAHAGARVTFSDYEPDALDFCRCNAERNLSPRTFANNVTFMHLDWRQLPALEKFDMILGADVVYDRKNFFPLINVFQSLLKPDGIGVLTEPGRSIGEHFFTMLREYGFLLTRSKHEVALDGKSSEVIRAIIAKPVLNA